MSHRKDGAEEAAIALLKQVVEISERDRDALPGSAVGHVKRALSIMRKRRRDVINRRNRQAWRAWPP